MTQCPEFRSSHTIAAPSDANFTKLAASYGNGLQLRSTAFMTPLYDSVRKCFDSLSPCAW